MKYLDIERKTNNQTSTKDKKWSTLILERKIIIKQVQKINHEVLNTKDKYQPTKYKRCCKNPSSKFAASTHTINTHCRY